MVISALILGLPDFEKSFEVHIDTLDRAIKGVLVQEGHPIAFESRKLKDVEYKYSTHEKEMMAVVYSLLWCMESIYVGTKILYQDQQRCQHLL